MRGRLMIVATFAVGETLYAEIILVADLLLGAPNADLAQKLDNDATGSA